MKKIFIHGNGTKEKGDKIIALLESLGGHNIYRINASGEGFYFINNIGKIDVSALHPPHGYEEHFIINDSHKEVVCDPESCSKLESTSAFYDPCKSCELND